MSLGPASLSFAIRWMAALTLPMAGGSARSSQNGCKYLSIILVNQQLGPVGLVFPDGMARPV
eukprot:14710952-Ditylum_brightwellii.AAC.1